MLSGLDNSKPYSPWGGAMIQKMVIFYYAILMARIYHLSELIKRRNFKY